MMMVRDQVDLMVEDLDVEVSYDAPIGREMTWYAVGGNADVLIEPRSVEGLVGVIKRAREAGIAVRMLGSGANLLVDDEGIDGLVVHLSHGVFREVSAIHRHRKNRGGDGSAGDGIRAMAGASMERIVMNLAKQGMSGLEMMAGIPASVGGAVRMNAGGKFGSIGEAVRAVGAIDLDGNMVTYQRDEIEFSYRRCSIVDPVIVWVELGLVAADPGVVHQRVKDIFAYKKKAQPMGAKSAGCAFKNPKVDVGNGGVGGVGGVMSAGRIIDEAGLKGFTVGKAMVSERHGNFIVAEKGASASDVIAVMDHVRKVVREERGIELEREMVVWKRKGGR